MSQHKSRQTESACIATSKCVKSHNIMSLLRDMKLTSRDNIFLSRDNIFLSRDKSVDLNGFYHVARLCLNVCDIILSAYDKFLACDVIY